MNRKPRKKSIKTEAPSKKPEDMTPEELALVAYHVSKDIDKLKRHGDELFKQYCAPIQEEINKKLNQLQLINQLIDQKESKG